MEGSMEGVINSVVKAALVGDMGASKIILDRLAPPRKDRFVSFDLPKIERPSL
jgi:hypothetical protein